MSPEMRIRLAREADLPAMNRIYNHYIPISTCTYHLEPESMESRQRWFAAHGPRHPVTVAELNGEVVGWGALSRFREREAYKYTVENSVYVRHDMQRRGVGSAILADLIERGRQAGHHVIIACIDGEQQASIELHRRFGFEMAGRLKEVGWKFDRRLDVVFMQLILNGP